MKAWGTFIVIELLCVLFMLMLLNMQIGTLIERVTLTP